jgi:hypothetical protein
MRRYQMIRINGLVNYKTSELEIGLKPDTINDKL